MAMALAQAEEAMAIDEVPVGAVIVRDGVVLAAAHNGREQLRDPTAHAEMIAITQAAAAIESWRLSQCTLYVTLEPCPMCAGAILQARLSKVVYGADDPKAGAVNSLFQLLDDPRLNHRVDVEFGVLLISLRRSDCSEKSDLTKKSEARACCVELTVYATTKRVKIGLRDPIPLQWLEMLGKMEVTREGDTPPSWPVWRHFRRKSCLT